jgi:hypothetical protein
MKKNLLMILMLFIIIGCQPSSSQKKEKVIKEKPVVNIQGKTLQTCVDTPKGYTRKKVKNNTFESFLRNYKLKKYGEPVLLYDGTKKSNQNAHIAVFKLPIENEDLQQCADSVIRIYAEYFYKTKQYSKISFQFVDGFKADYQKWLNGYRIKMNGNSFQWVKTKQYDTSYQSFQKYLRIVFAYASTLSLKEESKKIDKSKIQVGDIFIKAGSPGHVVMIVDMCQNKDNKKAYLLAQGYMPAQEFHLLKNNLHESDPWYYEDEITNSFDTPEYTFSKDDLRHLKYND